MPQKNWITSIEKQVDSLDGALQIDSTPQWDLDQPPFDIKVNFETSGAETVPRTVWIEGTVTPNSYIVGFKSQISAFNQETGQWVVNANACIARIMCHMLVERISDQGLPELCDSMKNIYSYYQARSKSPTPQVDYQGPVQARLGGIRTRPEFHVAEE